MVSFFVHIDQFYSFVLCNQITAFKEQKRFVSKFGSLNNDKAKAARSQNINREILSNTSNI